MKYTPKNLILDKRLTRDIDRYISLVLTFAMVFIASILIGGLLLQSEINYRQAVMNCVNSTEYSIEYCEYLAR